MRVDQPCATPDRNVHNFALYMEDALEGRPTTHLRAYPRLSSAAATDLAEQSCSVMREGQHGGAHACGDCPRRPTRLKSRPEGACCGVTGKHRQCDVPLEGAVKGPWGGRGVGSR